MKRTNIIKSTYNELNVGKLYYQPRLRRFFVIGKNDHQLPPAVLFWYDARNEELHHFANGRQVRFLSKKDVFYQITFGESKPVNRLLYHIHELPLKRYDKEIEQLLNDSAMQAVSYLFDKNGND
jgi:hypothetical protein